MTAVTDILTGVAGMITTAGLGTYNPAGTYTATQTGIYFNTVPDTPDRLVTLTFVAQQDDPSLPYGRGMVQVRVRGNPADPMDTETLTDQIFAVLHGATNVQFGSTNVTQILRRVSVPMGQDPAKRWTRTDQFYLDYTVTPTVNRPLGGSW